MHFRDPFSPPPSSSMKKKGGGRKKVAGESAKADGSAGTTLKKKATTSAKQTKKKNPPELSNIEESPPINQRKAPPEGIMPLLVPHTRRNTVRSTRKGLPQPPAHVYIGDPFESTTVGAILPCLPVFLLLTAIFSLSTTLLPTNIHLHPSLRRQPVRHPHQPIPLKTTMSRHSTT